MPCENILKKIARVSQPELKDAWGNKVMLLPSFYKFFLYFFCQMVKFKMSMKHTKCVGSRDESKQKVKFALKNTKKIWWRIKSSNGKVNEVEFLIIIERENVES